MTTISQSIAQWVCSTSFDAIPPDIVKTAKRSILDFIGVTIAGSTEPTAGIVSQYLHDFNGNHEASVIGFSCKTFCLEAAFANGLVGHCLDYEDYIHPVEGAGGPHITAVIFPAALAIAEKLKLSGLQLLEAYILGFEVVYRLGRAVEPVHFNLGWHNTETEGIFGATVAASKLLNLNVDQITCALGIAGSEASGLRENFGTMTKPFHAGQANAKGLRAALLAQKGFTSSATIFEGQNGFFKVMCEQCRPEELTHNLGKPFCLPKVKLKLYPCCGGSHRAIDATLELVTNHNIRDEDVEEVIVKCPPLTFTVMVYDKPRTALEGKFSMQFPLALAIREKMVTLRQFTDAKVLEPEIIKLMKKIKLVMAPELADAGKAAVPAIVDIGLKSGERHILRKDFHKGTPENPLSDSDLFLKYKSCAGMVISREAVDKSISLIMDLENVDDIDYLLSLIRN